MGKVIIEYVDKDVLNDRFFTLYQQDLIQSVIRLHNFNTNNNVYVNIFVSERGIIDFEIVTFDGEQHDYFIPCKNINSLKIKQVIEKIKELGC